jgi:hypothetical protein
LTVALGALAVAFAADASAQTFAPNPFEPACSVSASRRTAPRARDQGIRPLRHRPRPALRGRGAFPARRQQSGQPQPEGRPREASNLHHLGATTGLAQRFNRLDLSVKGSVDRTTYQDSELTDGTSVSNQDRNYWQYRSRAAPATSLRRASSRLSNSTPSSGSRSPRS